jgi:hypothetical protein
MSEKAPDSEDPGAFACAQGGLPVVGVIRMEILVAKKQKPAAFYRLMVNCSNRTPERWPRG